ncbi:hypothetical protein [Streptomyces sp. YS415]|uniref:hypothetical protein n=1 Tax=Streptomyces sp. YS415 TaxID=2944806 RepID=UPI00201FBCD4|nr:hypothetical protein [Streptomyces sp. YS415]MCL7424861.1 hypothetical protein [Streptomyces sp. YS415]
MTTYGLLPTRLHTPGARLLHGKSVESAVGAGQAGDWTDLDSDVWLRTAYVVRGWRHQGRIRVGFHWFDDREIADWSRAPYWHECGPGPGAPSWSLPPTESEVALCLAHADARVRTAALSRAESGALPASVLPLVLIRCADTDEGVRDLARAVFDRMLNGADESTLHRLAPLAALVGMRRRYGTWVREAVLGRLGGLPDEAMGKLLSAGDRESRIAGLYAGAAYGRLSTAHAWALADGDPDGGVRVHAVRTAIGVAHAAGQQTVDDTRGRVLARLHTDPSYEVRRRTFAAAVEADLLRAQDLADLAVGHRDRHIRWRSCAAALAGPDGDTVLDRLLHSREMRVRSAAIDRLRDAELVPHLTDPSAAIRAAVCRRLRAEGDDPRARYRALCVDSTAVEPAAVSGLGEQGTPDDAALLHPLTRHPQAAVRARALSALRVLGALPDEALPLFADDPNPGVRATAITALRKSPQLLGPLTHHRHADVRARAMPLLARAEAEQARGSDTSSRTRRTQPRLRPLRPPLQ